MMEWTKICGTADKELSFRRLLNSALIDFETHTHICIAYKSIQSLQNPSARHTERRTRKNRIKYENN